MAMSSLSGVPLSFIKMVKNYIFGIKSLPFWNHLRENHILYLKMTVKVSTIWSLKEILVSLTIWSAEPSSCSPILLIKQY